MVDTLQHEEPREMFRQAALRGLIVGQTRRGETAPNQLQEIPRLADELADALVRAIDAPPSQPASK
jgi:hypothetical protein